MIVKLLSLFLIILASSQQTFSADVSASVKDTSIYRGVGNRATIAVYGSLLRQNIGNIEFIIEYDSRVLEIVSAMGNTTTSLQNPIIIDKEFSNLEKSTFKINDTNPKFTDDGVLFYLIVEGLASEDSLSQIKFIQVSLDENVIDDADFESGEILVSGQPVFKIPPEGIGQNYPNPFRASTKISFYLRNETKVNFKLYSAAGKLVRSGNEDDNLIKFEIFAPDGEIISNDKNKALPQGLYEMRITPLAWKFASGPYFLVMETSSGVYHKSILYNK